jgi:hypothetical protein
MTKPAPHTRTKVARIPTCDLPHPDETILAYADARMVKGPAAGSWAYLCKGHFVEYGCSLGVGCGQELVLDS